MDKNLRKTLRLFFRALFITGICTVIAVIINGIISLPKETDAAPVINPAVCAGAIKTVDLKVDIAKIQKNIEEENKRKEEEARKAEEEKKKQEEAKRLEEERKAKEEEEARFAKETSSWTTGIASAYGGSSDASVADNARTATGATVNDSSMGVAIPLSWGRSDLYGHKVLIEYNGDVVEATINDCGGMGGGSRSLDLQPGVFKSFGFNSCNAWGLREVRYKIL